MSSFKIRDKIIGINLMEANLNGQSATITGFENACIKVEWDSNKTTGTYYEWRFKKLPSWRERLQK